MPFMAVYAMVVWLLCGAMTNEWWWQLVCYGVATYLTVELNNINALIRIFSRTVSGAFLVLTSCACFLFSDLRLAIMLVCLVASLLLLFNTYQDDTAVGTIYYAFLFLSIASMAYVHVLFFLPLIWLLMTTNIMSMSWRTWIASLFGMLTPYWFGSVWLIHQRDYALIVDHFSALMVFEDPFNLYGITANQKYTLALTTLMAITGAIHFIHKNYLDKIRTRMFYGFFIWMDLAAFAFLLLQPQHFNAMLLIMMLNTAPLIAHFVALTSNRLTNIIFILLMTVTTMLTAYNIWITSSLF